jgi:hypothetical protein
MRGALSSLALVTLLSGCSGCGKDAPAPGDWSTGAVPAPTAAGSVATETGAAGDAGPRDENTYGAPNGANIPAEKLVHALNRKRIPPYAGPMGTLKGRVRIEGDPPPDTGLKFPQRCTESTSAYGKLFRIGLDKALADVLVAVTGYEDRGWVPALDEAVKAPLHGCVPKQLTYAITFGQRLDAFNVDSTTFSYMPYLDGAGAAGRTIMVAIPHGDAVKLYPAAKSPFHYMLRDQLDSNMSAQVFVLNYSTHDVTDLAGQYSIKRIPVGKVHVGVLLPVIDKHEERDIEIKEGDNVLDVTLHFDKTKDIPQHSLVGPAPSTSASASAAVPVKPPPPAPH